MEQGTFTALEKYFNQRVEALFGADDPADLLGNTRGVYLDGYGAVFTTEASLVVTPAPSPFRPPISKELAESVRKRKTDRLPFLEAAMKDMIRKMATTLIQVPANQQMVLVVRFYYQPWEDMNGMPSQILMRAEMHGSASSCRPGRSVDGMPAVSVPMAVVEPGLLGRIRCQGQDQAGGRGCQYDGEGQLQPGQPRQVDGGQARAGDVELAHDVLDGGPR